MIEEFKKDMKDNGRSFKWFHKRYIARYDVSYISFIQQLNMFAPVKPEVEAELTKYLTNVKED